MLRLIFSRMISVIERDLHYDAGYMREVLEAGPWTFARFALMTGLGRGGRAPAAAAAVAGLVGTLAEDCGPCTQLSVDLALRAGVPAPEIKAILAGDEAAMGDSAALAYRFARATLARDLEAADVARVEILRRWGRPALVEISLAHAMSRFYPTLKYALGHGHACARLAVQGEAAAFQRPLAEAA